jgi:pSer/pThr/pTyr-binding forkhead associated (FHA) protein
MLTSHLTSPSENTVVFGQSIPQLEIPLPEGSHCVGLSDHASWEIGRGKKNQIVLPSKCVSRLHAIIELVLTGNLYFVYIRDAGSLNGTFVNERQIVDKVFLLDGDVITLGNMTLMFHYPAQRNQTERDMLSHPSAQTESA